jgi:hypothetical protein
MDRRYLGRAGVRTTDAGFFRHDASPLHVGRSLRFSACSLDPSPHHRVCSDSAKQNAPETPTPVCQQATPIWGDAVPQSAHMIVCTVQPSIAVVARENNAESHS